MFWSGGRTRGGRIDRASMGSVPSGQCAIVAEVRPECEVARVYSDGENKQGLALGKTTCVSLTISDVTGGVNENQHGTLLILQTFFSSQIDSAVVFVAFGVVFVSWMRRIFLTFAEAATRGSRASWNKG